MLELDVCGHAACLSRIDPAAARVALAVAAAPVPRAAASRDPPVLQLPPAAAGFNMSSEDLMEHVPDDLYDKEYDKRYNPMAKKVTAGSRKKGSVVPPSVGNTHWHHQ